jgi:hypothetical protein
MVGQTLLAETEPMPNSWCRIIYTPRGTGVSVNENLTTTFTSNSEFTFGTIVRYLSQETTSRIKKVTPSDL